MRTIVMGAGVIGTATAYFLAKQGHEVVVLDRQSGAALETSFGNGGVLHTSECEPWARPGMVANVLKWLGKEDAPLLLRPSALPHMWRWGIGFALNCSTAPYRRNTMANMRLAFLTLEALRAIREEAAFDYDMRQTGTMKIYSDRQAFAKVQTECEVLAPHGLRFEVCDVARCIALEPALEPIADTLVGALYFPPDEAGDCHKFTRGLAQHSESLGVTFQFGTEIKRLVRKSGRVVGVETASGRVEGDNFVAALGSYTPLLLRTVGVRVPIYPVKGVTITVPAEGWPNPLGMPIIDDTRLFGLVPLGNRLRVSGSAEITGYDTVPSRARCQAIIDNVIGVFPEFAKCYTPETASYWAGLRPMTPTGTPCLGRTKIANLFVNAGHGHLGWTMSCGSAQVVANIVAGKDPGIDMDRLALDQR